MRIGLFIDTYYPHVQGVATSTRQLKQALEARGHTVFIVTVKAPGYTDTEQNVVRLPSIDPVIANGMRAIAFYPGILRRLKRLELDIVHSQMPLGVGLLADALAKEEGIPHVHTVHTIYAELAKHYPATLTAATVLASLVYPLYYATTRKALIMMPKLQQETDINLIKRQSWRLYTLFCNHTDEVIAPSGHLAEKLRYFGVTTPLHTIPNGVDTAAFRNGDNKELAEEITGGWNQDSFYVLSVGRLSAEKRTDHLIRAAALASERIDIRLILVGDGPMKESYEELSRELGLGDRVIFTGMQNQEAIAALMRACQLFALVSKDFDNQPMVILEAISAGLPILYCDDNLEEGLTPRNALLTNPDHRSLAEGIVSLHEDRRKLKTFSDESLRLSRDYDIRVMVQRIENVYKDAILRHGSPA